MLEITNHVSVQDKEVELTAVRASGPGGQNVNKVSSAIHLRFNINASSLPDNIKTKILRLRDKRITADGVVIIKAQRFREQDKNREDALLRLQTLIKKALHKQKKRIPTKPSKAAKRRRVDNKTRRGKVKTLRAKVQSQD